MFEENFGFPTDRQREKGQLKSAKIDTEEEGRGQKRRQKTEEKEGERRQEEGPFGQE